MRNHVWIAALIAAVPTPGTAQAGPATPPPALDANVARAMREFGVPGLSIAIVKDGRVVLAKGYGVRRLGDPAPVDADTRFGIASNTKAFTATALGLLVEEGKLEWDAPVVRYLPAFQMYDPWVTRQITVRDLLVHRSGLGLGAGDLLWWPPSTYDRPEIMRRLRFIEPATSFRSAYAYDNVLYLVAGQLIEAVSGQSWEDFVTDRILRPVGMREAVVLHSAAGQSGNVAATHARVDGKVQVVAPFLSDNTNPAGGINAGAADMARWLIAQLDSGRVGTTRLWSERTQRELWSLVTPIPFGTPPPSLAPLATNFNGYALGFNVREYRGEQLVTHTGGLPGYVSRVAMLPGRKLGVAVLTNAESGAAFNAIAWYILDYYVGAKAFDWITPYAALVARGDSMASAEEAGAAAARDSMSGPSLPLPRYAGTYTDAWYGDILVREEGARLVMEFSHTPSLVGDMTHWQYDTFLVRWRDRELRADALVTFSLDADGKIAQATMRALSPATDFSFDFQDLLLRPVPTGGR
ncbi:MAG: serine hydrolase [Gemmatimonadales bacterium]